MELKGHGGTTMKPKRKCYGEEYYELDNIYNEDVNERYGIKETSVWYNWHEYFFRVIKSLFLQFSHVFHKELAETVSFFGTSEMRGWLFF